MPNANSFRHAEDLRRPELTMPLTAHVCEECMLVQLENNERADFFFDDQYPYFSSWSQSWLDHGRAYAEAMIADLGLNADSLVIEVGSNDGYLLQCFASVAVPTLGIDPSGNVAEAARANHGIETIVDFFGAALAQTLADQGRSPDLMIANNVLAHVPDPNDFLSGFKRLLAPDGLITFEFPHVMELIRHCQFDTIYHEHFMYLSLLAVESMLQRNGLKAVRVEPLTTHGGSLRLYVRHDTWDGPIDPSVAAFRAKETAAGLNTLAAYQAFPEAVAALKRRLLSLLIEIKDAGKSIAGYGAPAKGNTLLNYCGVGLDMIDFTVDRNTWKHGLYLPGSRIPILPVSALDERRPDFVMVLPWNLKNEIISSMVHISDWRGRFIVPAPEPGIL
jgi:SAM-dependent methyltransferase